MAHEDGCGLVDLGEDGLLVPQGHVGGEGCSSAAAASSSLVNNKWNIRYLHLTELV